TCTLPLCGGTPSITSPNLSHFSYTIGHGSPLPSGAGFQPARSQDGCATVPKNPHLPLGCDPCPSTTSTPSHQLSVTVEKREATVGTPTLGKRTHFTFGGLFRFTQQSLGEIFDHP